MKTASHSFALSELTPRERYKLLSSLIIPRPIALVGTRGADGTDNAAPYSFFNVFSEEPPLVVLGLQVNAAGERKDTAVNIARDREFVVNLVDEELAEAMNICAIDFPPDESEIEAAKLSLEDSLTIAPRRIRESPAALECRETQTLHFSERRDIVIGEVSHVHVRENVIDAKKLNVDLDHYKPVGRLFAGLYSLQSERFDMPRISVEEWKSNE